MRQTFDFDKVVDRRGTNSYKWDSAPAADVLPMWVADMDFPTAQPITDAIRERVGHGIFGYTRVPGEYYESVIKWFARRHRWSIRPEWMIYTSGVVPAISAVIKALTRPGDKVVVQTPVYNCFFSSIRNNGCETVSSPLRRVGPTYVMDYDDLEEKVSRPGVKIFLLCNPHNPTGRVWTRQELERAGEICLRHGVTVLSDEIHCELVYKGREYTPFASISEDFQRNTVTCISPSKAFNLAGLQIANIVSSEQETLNKIDRAININEVCDVNPFGVIATIAAYNRGEDWLDGLLDYLHDNYTAMRKFCQEQLPDFPIADLEGTYLVWMDCKAAGMKSEQLEHSLVEKARLWLNSGTMYGAEGEGFMRWNIACPRAVMMEGLRRFKGYVDNYVHGQASETGRG